MNWKNYIIYVPYVLLVIANFIYLYANGFQPIGTYPQLFLYNVLFFLIIGTVIIIKLNLLLHSWFVKQQGDVKQKTRKAITKFNETVDFVFSVFKKGNQRMMLKIFLYFNIWIAINKYVPNVLLGVLVGTYFQYRNVIQQKFKNQFQQLDQMTNQLIKSFLQKLPRYQPVSNQQIQRSKNYKAE